MREAARMLLALLFLLFMESYEVNAFSIMRQLDLKLPDFLKSAPPLEKKAKFTYTHLEGNGQLWEVQSPGGANGKISLVIDPIASQLDFGIPWFYRANKRFLSEKETINVITSAKPTHCLLTMGLDDHTHLPTISKLRDSLPDMKYIVAPSCVKKLLDFGVPTDLVTTLKHGEECELFSHTTMREHITGKVTATEGALVGPPWQTRENGFVVELKSSRGGMEKSISIYYEPHSDVLLNNIQNVRADVMVAPFTKQSIPANAPPQAQYTLVYGAETTLRIAETIRAKVIVPLANGKFDIDGSLAKLVEASGDYRDLEALVKERNKHKENESETVTVVKPTPGNPLSINI